MNWRFTPGEYPLLHNSRLLLLIVADPGDLPLAELESLMAGAEDAETVLDYLARHGVSELPPFFLMQWGSPSTVILRGAIEVELQSGDTGSQFLNAQGLRSWQETCVDEITSMRVTVVSTGQSHSRDLGDRPLSMVSEVRFDTASQTPEEPALDEARSALSPAEHQIQQAGNNAFDELFGATIYGDIELAAVRQESAPETAQHPSPVEEPDRDNQRIPEETSATYAFNGSSVQVPSQFCAYGHPNPPQHPLCWNCKTVVHPGPLVSATRPSLGWLEFTDGKRIPLDRNIVIGRNPVIHRMSAVDLPKLVTVESPNQDISRNHLSVTLNGWQIQLDDLNTTNGTTVVQPTGVTFRLVPGQSYVAESGCRVQLGDGMEFWVNGILA